MMFPQVATSALLVFHTRAIAWIAGHLEEFAPGELAVHRYDARRKALGELAVAALIAHRLQPEYRPPELRRVVSFLHRQATQPEFGKRAIAVPGLLRLHLLIMAALERYGVTVPELRACIMAGLDMRAQAGRETTPWQDLSMKYLLEESAIPHDYPSDLDLYRRSTLSRLPSIPYLSDHDVYAITHHIFFLSHFGDRSVCEVFGPTLDATRDYIRALLAMYLVRQHADLVGELLICCACLGPEDTTVTRAAWSYLVGIQHEDGHVPPPPAAALEPRAHEPAVSFEIVYHPTVVGFIASTLAIAQRGAA